jgi:hypothetical protein
MGSTFRMKAINSTKAAARELHLFSVTRCTSAGKVGKNKLPKLPSSKRTSQQSLHFVRADETSSEEKPVHLS